MNTKGFSSLVIILLALGFVILGGMVWYFGGQRIIPPSMGIGAATSTPQDASVQQVATASPIDTSAWPVFRNEAGYEFNYPQDALVTSSPSAPLLRSGQTRIEFPASYYVSPKTTLTSVSITATSTPDVASCAGQSESIRGVMPPTQITVGANTFLYTVSDACGAGSCDTYNRYAIYRGGICYAFAIDTGTGNPDVYKDGTAKMDAYVNQVTQNNTTDSKKLNEIAMQILSTFQLVNTSTTAVSNLSTFSSVQLGISFQYDPQQVTPTVSENTVSFGGDSIQVFSKDPASSFADAIRTTILKGYSSSCTVNTGENSYPALTQRGWIVGDITDPLWHSTPTNNNCNDTYVNQGAPGLFLYNPSFPSKFLFWRGGAAIDTSSIFETLTFSTP